MIGSGIPLSMPQEESLVSDTSSSTYETLIQPHGYLSNDLAVLKEPFVLVQQCGPPQKTTVAHGHLQWKNTGRRALLVGLTYCSEDSLQQQPWNYIDVRRFGEKLVEEFGFKERDLQVLTDVPCILRGNVANLANVLTGLRWLLRGTKKGDSVVFLFGGRTEQNGNGLVCSDGVLSEATLEKELLRACPNGVNLLVLLQGDLRTNILQLPYELSGSGMLSRDMQRSRSIALSSADGDVADDGGTRLTRGSSGSGTGSSIDPKKSIKSKVGLFKRKKPMIQQRNVVVIRQNSLHAGCDASKLPTHQWGRAPAHTLVFALCKALDLKSEWQIAELLLQMCQDAQELWNSTATVGTFLEADLSQYFLL